MKNPLVVSSLFWKGAFDIYEAPDPERYDCIFFSNSKTIGKRAEERRWTYCEVPFPSDYHDAIVPSLHSKYAKFIQFVEDPYMEDWGFSRYDSILYFDHKLKVLGRHVSDIAGICGGERIVIRSTPSKKSSIWQEIDGAGGQSRYTRNMTCTKSYVSKFIARGASPDTLVANTGLIYYRDAAWALDLTNRVYRACRMLEQPECQILWALHAQPFVDDIKVIGRDHPAVADIVREDPLVARSGKAAIRARKAVRRLKRLYRRR
jgi:hypothetical protein